MKYDFDELTGIVNRIPKLMTTKFCFLICLRMFKILDARKRLQKTLSKHVLFFCSISSGYCKLNPLLNAFFKLRLHFCDEVFWEIMGESPYIYFDNQNGFVEMIGFFVPFITCPCTNLDTSNYKLLFLVSKSTAEFTFKLVYLTVETNKSLMMLWEITVSDREGIQGVGTTLLIENFVIFMCETDKKWQRPSTLWSGPKS